MQERKLWSLQELPGNSYCVLTSVDLSDIINMSFCQGMKQFGGRGLLKKKCLERACEDLKI